MHRHQTPKKLRIVSKISLIVITSLRKNPATNTTSKGLMLKTRVILPTGPRFNALKKRIELAQNNIHKPIRRQSLLPTEKKLIPHRVPQMNIALENITVLNARTSNPFR